MSQRWFALVALLAATVSQPGLDVGPASATSTGAKVDLSFEFEGKADFTLLDEAPWVCTGTNTNENETGHVSWKTTYDEGMAVAISGGHSAFKQSGVAVEGAEHTWSYTGNSPGCKGAPAAHVHCTSDNIIPSVPDGTPPEIDVIENNQGGIKIGQIDATGDDFYAQNITGTAGVCTVASSNRMALAVLLGEEKESIPKLFSGSWDFVSPSDISQLAQSGAPIQIPLESHIGGKCVDQYHPQCSVDIDEDATITITKHT